MEANLIPTSQHAAPTQPPTLLMVAPPRENVLSSYQQGHSKVVGVTLIIGGLFSIIFHSISIHILQFPDGLCDRSYLIGVRVIGYGIWSGVLCLIAGCMGVAAARGRTRCKITSFMVMTILSASACFFQLLFGVISAAMTSDALRIFCNMDDTHHHYYRCADDNENIALCRTFKSALAMDALVATLAIVDGFAAIWGSAICCKVICCCGGSAIPMYGMTVFNQQQGGEVTLQPCAVAPTATASGGFIYQPPQLYNASTSVAPGAAPAYAALATAPPSYDYAQSWTEKRPLPD